MIEDNFSRKEFILKGKDDRLYNLMILNEQDKITFKSNIIDNIWSIQYVLSINITKFYSINKIFRKYNSINEIFIKYFNDIKKEQINISSNDNKIIIYFSDNDIVEIPFILEPNEMKIDIIIRKLCDKIKDIDTLKTELDKQKIENDNLKNELIKRRNENEKNINEIRKEIESLKEAINILSQKELYDNKLENKTRKINQMKEDIKKLGKNKKLAEYAKKEEITGKNEFSILESESNLNSKDEFKKDFEEKNNTANEMNSLMNNFKSKLICKSDKSSKIKVKNSDEIKQQNISIDKCKKMIVSSDNEKIIEELIQFEKDEIKQDLNIKITNIGNDKGFKILYMVIDTNTSSDNLLFWENMINPIYHRLTLDGPLLKGESLNNIITLYFKEPKIGEYTIFTYIREKPKGDNLSLPLKITINLIEDSEINERKEEEEKKDYFKREENNKRMQEKNENIDYKGVDKIKVEEMLNFLENEYNICSIFDKEEIINKIIEFNCDIQSINEWIDDIL